MKIFSVLAGVAGAMAITSAASATAYDFSYLGQDGDTFSGSFSGTQTGDFSGPLNVLSYVGGPGSCYGDGCYVAGGASVNLTNPMADNFLFINNASSNYFYVIPWSNGGDNTTAVQGFFDGVPYENYNGEFVATNLVVSAVSAVPEPGTWALMFGGLAVIGGMLRIASRRREIEAAGIAAA
jgi:hypothetical protein